MPFNLGVTPERLTVSLSKDGRFTGALLSGTDDWDPDARIELRFSVEGSDDAPIVWPAVIDGHRAEWDQHPDDSRQVLEGGAFVARLFFNDLLWAKGAARDVG